ncbi:MAG: PASTA domain-containing protein, partial [Prevotella salivae]|nr:PASTA domain-containing protein [Segatella salivae]
PASGGGMSGVVFHNIAEGIMAQSLKLDVKDARDSSSVLIPDVKAGNILAADYVLTHLGINTNKSWSGSYADGNPIWGKAEKKNGNKTILLERETINNGKYIPNVVGMGARDAVFLLERRGVKTIVSGRGKVVKQSLEPGHYIKKGERITLVLE